MKYLYWRKDVLWCTYPLPGFPGRYSLKIRSMGGLRDKRFCEDIGIKILEHLRSLQVSGTLYGYEEFKLRAKAGRLFESKVSVEHNPKFWRLVGRYWYFHLRHQKSGGNDRYHLIHSLKKFGNRYAREIETGEVENWIAGMKGKSAVNTINLRLSYMQAVYNYDADSKSPINYNPVRKIEKLKGGNVRKFLLTPEQFELNYKYLLGECKRFGLYYLALWETGRRPQEVAAYTWDMYDSQRRIMHIPAGINKTDDADEIPVSGRLHAAIMDSERVCVLIFPNKLRNPFVYYTKDGASRNCNNRYINMLKKKFGEHAGVIRDTRRGFVTRKTEDEGHRIEDVMLLTGHSTYSTVKRYRIGKLETKRKVIDSGGDLPANVVQFKQAM